MLLGLDTSTERFEDESRRLWDAEVKQLVGIRRARRRPGRGRRYQIGRDEPEEGDRSRGVGDPGKLGLHGLARYDKPLPRLHSLHGQERVDIREPDLVPADKLVELGDQVLVGIE